MDEFINKVNLAESATFLGGSAPNCEEEEGEFKCRDNGVCIPKIWVCNGVPNCGDWSDESEEACGKNNGLQKTKSDFFCTSDEFMKCYEELKCARVCDGVPECAGNEDELDCEKPSLDRRDLDLNTTEGYLFMKMNPHLFKPPVNELILTLKPPAGMTIVLIFNNIKLRQSSTGECENYVQIFDADSAPFTIMSNGTARNKFCSQSQLPANFVFLSKLLRIKYSFKTFSPLDHFISTAESSIREDYDSAAWRNMLLKGNEQALPLHRISKEEYEQITKEGMNQIKIKSNATLYAPNLDVFPKLLEMYHNSTLPPFTDFRQLTYFNQQLVKYNGYAAEDFIVQCSFDGCSSADFHAFQHPYYGNCFTFNSIRNVPNSDNYTTTSRTGKAYGLKLTLFLDVDEYFGLFASNAGAVVLVHDNELHPQVLQKSFSISAGEISSIGVSSKRTERFGGKYSFCYRNWPDNLKLNEKFRLAWPQYSQSSCVQFCTRNEMAQKCGCTDDFDTDFSVDEEINKNSIRYCNHTDSCRIGIYQKLRKGLLRCDCPPACNTTDFNLLLSHADWPTPSNLPYVLSDLFRSNSTRVKTFAAELIKLSNESKHGRFWSYSNLTVNLARLEIFMEQLNFYVVSESPSYQKTDLLSDFGANVGLWLGWSALTLFEVFHFLKKIFCSFTTRKATNTSKKGSQKGSLSAKRAKRASVQLSSTSNGSQTSLSSTKQGSTSNLSLKSATKTSSL